MGDIGKSKCHSYFCLGIEIGNVKWLKYSTERVSTHKIIEWRLC